MHVRGSDRVWFEHVVRSVARMASSGLRRFRDPPIDHDMGDMDALGMEFAGKRLRQSAQRELAHRERAEFANPLMPADAPVNSIVPSLFASMRGAA